ncbi:hypothetical protein GEMRC1_008947 [Eukaryota sp. GEM-RC1]
MDSSWFLVHPFWLRLKSLTPLLIENGNWEQSGKLKKPGKKYFLELASRCIQKLNEQHDDDGLTYPRKAMILCGLALNTTGRWEESQLKPNLQLIIDKYKTNFLGLKPDTWPISDEEQQNGDDDIDE